MNEKYIFEFNELDCEFIKKKYIYCEMNPDRLEGHVLGNRYEIIERIQDKKNSIIYKANCKLTKKLVFVEVCKQKLIISDEDKSFVEYQTFRLVEENISFKFNENIMSLFDIGNEKDVVYVVKEYFEGSTLSEYIEKHKRLYIEQAINISRQIINGLKDVENEYFCKYGSFALCPENIYIDRNENIKLNLTTMQSGLRIFKDEQFLPNAENFDYISPEIARGLEYNFSSVIYSLGCIMYRLFTGKTPYTENGMVKLALEHIQTIPESPMTVNELIPKSISDVIEKCMRKNPAERYQSCEGILNDCSLLRED